MTGDKALNIVGAIVTLAIITTIVARPNTVKVIGALGDAFKSAIYVGLGGGQKF